MQMFGHLCLIRMFLFVNTEFLQRFLVKNQCRQRAICLKHGRIHFISSQRERRRGLPESRLYVLVSTQQAMHPIQRSLHQGWRTVFCLRCEGEHTYTLARQTYIAFGSVVAVYFLLSLLLYDMFTKYLFRMRRWLRRALPSRSPRMLGGKWRYYLSALAVSWGCFREIQGGNW